MACRALGEDELELSSNHGIRWREASHRASKNLLLTWHARITCLRRHAGIHEVRPGAHAISRRSARLKPSSLLFQKKTDAGIYGPAAS